MANHPRMRLVAGGDIGFGKPLAYGFFAFVFK